MGVVVLGLTVALFARSSPPEVATVGKPAPEFTVPLLDGGRFRLGFHVQNDGRPVIMNLWASWCIPCRVETPELSTFAEDNPQVKVIGVAVRDTEAQARRFAEEFEPFHDLAFGDDAFQEKYPTFGLPATFHISGDGTLTEIVYGIVNTERLEELAEGN